MVQCREEETSGLASDRNSSNPPTTLRANCFRYSFDNDKIAAQSSRLHMAFVQGMKDKATLAASGAIRHPAINRYATILQAASRVFTVTKQCGVSQLFFFRSSSPSRTDIGLKSKFLEVNIKTPDSRWSRLSRVPAFHSYLLMMVDPVLSTDQSNPFRRNSVKRFPFPSARHWSCLTRFQQVRYHLRARLSISALSRHPYGAFLHRQTSPRGRPTSPPEEKP